jgi:dienelactone hydrolase
VDWSEPRYPDVLALLPTAIAYLLRREEVDPKRIGALGVDLGGDLVIRAASTDGRIKSVLAVAPYLCEANTKPGLSILKEMSYWQALLWSRSTNREKLVMELAAISSMEKLEGRPLLLVYGEEDGITSAEVAISSGRTKLLPGEGHLSIPRSQKLASLAVQWFNETLESE